MPGMYKYSMEIESNVKKLLLDTKELQDRMDTLEGKEYKINLNIDEKKLGNVISNLEKMLDSLGKGTGDFKQFENLSKELSSIVSEVQSLSKAFGKVDDSGAKTLLSSIQNIDKSLSELSQNILNINKNMSNMGGNTSGAVKQVENITNESKKAASALEGVAKAQAKVNGQKTNISSDSNPAIEQQNKLQEELKETRQQAEKARQSISELVKGRDVVSQNWYREKGTVVGKDSKGNDITRDTDEFSFVERLKNGQLQTVLATYNEETGKWAEQVINVRTAFEQVEKAIISADNKIASLEISKEKILAAHPEYDATADDNQIAIERKKRDELQNTLNLYDQEKEYVFEIEATNKRIADNQERLNNKKQSQTNLQATKEFEASDKANQKKFQDFQKEQTDYVESVNKVNSAIQKTDEILDTLPLHDKLDSQFLDMIDSVDNLNSKLKSGELTLSEYKNEVKSVTSEYFKMVSIQQKRDVEDYNANAKTNLENTKNIQAEWDKNIKAIQDYMDAVTKLNNLKAKDKGTGSEANQIALQTQNVEKLKQDAWDARQNLSSMQAENPDIIAWKQWVDMMELFDQASKGSAESVAKLKDVLDNIKAPSLDKYENKLSSYQTKKAGYDATIARFNDGGWASNAYLENVQAVKNAVKKYEDLLSNIKAKGGIASEEDVQKLKEYEGEIRKTISTVTNMSASEKGYNFVSGQKELDKIHKLLEENSRMSSEAKNKIKAYYAEIESGNPSMSLDRIHGEIMKIYNAEVEAGRAGKSMWSIIKSSGLHQIAAQMAGMFGFYDVINLGKEAVSTIVSLDDALVDLKKTTAMNETQLEDFYYDANDVAKQMGVTTEEIITQASAWSRLGYSSQEAATTMAKLSSKFASISPGMSTDEAQEGLVSIMKAFDIDPDDVETEIMDKVNVLGNKFAEENQDVIEGLKRSAAAMSAMGQSFTDTAALFTGGMEILQDSESMGTALRTLSMRVRGYDEETNQLSDDLVNVTGKVADLTKTAQDSQGVSLFTDATQEHYRSMVEYLGDIADRWDQISEKNQTELLQKLFGKNRANESVCPYVQKCA